MFERYKRKVLADFLPRDFPNSVRPGYYQYSKYMFLGNICGNIMMFISTQVLINSLGFNRNQSMAMSAGLNYVLKDTIGQLGIKFIINYHH